MVMSREWLVVFRKNQGLSQEAVADQAGITRQYYGMIENGDRMPSVSVAKKIGKILSFNWVIFFDSKGNKMLPKRRQGA